ncbi:conserved hypothetical protein [Methylocella tundrae]|uniref:TonB C-terminal domain-containing protein n=1 Tax=Methylocella tundrae TaxID=227605 RepID=A0A8B6M3M0_METTU|nr:cell envelope integrity protein TolA [Methylocella tundrae]VTZ48973.1 conserved hypothetical protein [Methylocella tundrae]
MELTPELLDPDDRERKSRAANAGVGRPRSDDFAASEALDADWKNLEAARARSRPYELCAPDRTALGDCSPPAAPVDLPRADDPEARSNLVIEEKERIFEPRFGPTPFERGLLWLLAASLAAHMCLFLLFAWFSPKSTAAQQVKETPVEVVVEKPPEPSKATENALGSKVENTSEAKAADSKASDLQVAQQKAAEQKAVEQKAAEEKAAEQKAAEQKAAEQKAVEQKAAEEKAAEQKAAEQKAAEEKAAEQKAAEQKAAEQKAAEQKAAEQKAAEQKAAEEKAAEQKAAEQKAAEEKAAEEKAAEQKAAEQKRVDKKASAQAKGRSPSSTATGQKTPSGKSATKAAAAKPAPATSAVNQSGASGSRFGTQAGLQLPFDNGPDIFRAVAVPLPTEGGDELLSYKEIVFGLLERAKQYPQSARERGAHGSAVVSFTLNDAGDLTNVSLLQSSGETDLDIESLALVSRAAPFPRPPLGAQRSFAAEITFGLERND